MSKDQTVTKASNLFSMASFETQCRLPDIQVDFTAPFNLNKTSNSIVPAFCKDRKFFTPAFILPRDKEYYQANLCFERKFFQLRVRTAEARSLSYALNSQKQVRIDVIGPEEKCCQICRIKFESYIDHIQEDTHIKGIESNTTKNYIMQLCGKYQEQLKKGQDQRKRKTIKKRKQRKVLFSKADSLPQKVTRRAKK